MAESIINKDLRTDDSLYNQAIQKSINTIPEEIVEGHSQAMYKPGAIVDRAASVSDYHKMANADLSNRISNTIADKYGNAAAGIYNTFAPGLSIPASLAYDATQARQRMEPDSGLAGFYEAFMNESPFSAAYQRAVGAADPFFQQFGMTTVPENALKNNLEPTNINFTNYLKDGNTFGMKPEPMVPGSSVMDGSVLGPAGKTPADIAKTNNPYDFSEVDAQTIDEITAPQVSPFLGNADYQGDPNAIQREPQGLFSRVVEGGKNFLGAAKDFMPNFGIMGLLSNMDQFDTLSPEDQAFILEQSGGNRPSKDPFGINRRSAFGNYAQYVRDKGIFAPGKRGEYYRSISGLDQALMDTLDREQKAKAAYEQQIRDAANEAARNAARARSITAGYGGSDDSPGATGPTAAGAGMGVGGGYASDYFGADGGSVPTGLATMFVEKR